MSSIVSPGSSARRSQFARETLEVQVEPEESTVPDRGRVVREVAAREPPVANRHAGLVDRHELAVDERAAGFHPLHRHASTLHRVRVAVAGATGGLGGAVARAVEAASDLILVARIGRSVTPDERGFTTVAEALDATDPDVFVECTLPHLATGHIEAAIGRGIATVVGTTAWDKPRVDASARSAGVAVFYAPNYAIGALMMFDLSEVAAATLGDCEIVEWHSDAKRDIPSGTSSHAAARIEAITGARPPISSLRIPGPISHHEVVFGAAGQTLRIAHDITSNDAFAPGMLRAIRGVVKLPGGLTVGLDSL